ncbi:MAG TPA: carboxylesterase family protein [Kofleriaceae bacterium]
MWAFTAACAGSFDDEAASAEAVEATDLATIGADVAIDSGPIHGAASGDLVVFKGVPYAQAGRWQAPGAPARWTQRRDATAFGPACPQAGHADLPQAEACLTVNVWAHAGPAAHRPVIVFIHGGGYVEGSSRDPTYDGAGLARGADAIVVTLNYRLGVLGYLALPQLAAGDGGIGNYGLRDQLAALAWVQRNIAAFGGDPAHVLVTGESAGGASVCTLVGSPRARGLFSAAAIQSGPCRMALDPLRSTGTFPPAEGFAIVAVAAPLGCTSGDVAGCLRGKSVAQILALPLRPTPTPASRSAPPCRSSTAWC